MRISRPGLPGVLIQKDTCLLYTSRDGGFLTMDEDHFLHLTDVGREVAEKIYERHCFFTEQLIAAGVDPRTAEADACRIEQDVYKRQHQHREQPESAGERRGSGRTSELGGELGF